jgi:sulfur-oxidizing protein SoxX
MRKRAIHLLAAGIAGVVLAVSTSLASAAEAKKEPTGQDLAFDKKKGNCLACHAMPTDPKAVTLTNIGPPLIAMKSRFPDRQKLFNQIWDAQVANPQTVMPPFGKHKILSDQEINKIIDFLYTL